MERKNLSEVDVHDLANLLISDAKVMMVDDEPINMEVLQIHLEDEGYERFVVMSDSTRAMDRIKQEMPDVLLLDLVMPEVTGYDILKLIRADESLRYLPVIVLTSANDPDTKLRALHLGATDFLAKPIDASELALRMRNTLSAIAWQKRMSEVDPLTDLPNRIWFTNMLRAQLNEADRSNSAFALVLININRFKAINDSLGPAKGDEMLLSFSQRIVGCYRNGLSQPWFSNHQSLNELPIVARLDGDRFVILVPLQDKTLVDTILTESTDRFNQSLDKPFMVAGQAIYLSASVGASIVLTAKDSVESLINNAETALRHAKKRNDSMCAIYTKDMDAKARELLSIENGLRTAVENGEIFVVYQPKVDVQTGLIRGAEALVRWMHPELGMVSPVQFIDLAEDSGMIVSIGEYVLREACRQTRMWQEKGFVHFRIAVNVSIRQLYEPDFLDTVKCALKDTGLPPESLIIELTENMIMENAEVNIVTLQNLKSLGIKLSIDDFGTGYSSLSYLQKFPIDQLKIDQSFVREIQSDDQPIPIVKAIISLSHDLGLNVVAEGVEEQFQLLHLRALKCEEYQGYFFSKPVIADEFELLLQEDLRKRA